MGNVYGVANPLALPVLYGTASGADVSCPAGSETTVISTGAIAALNAGDYYPFAFGSLAILLGGTAPSALIIAMRLGSAADVATYTFPPALLVNGATIIAPVMLVGANSGSAWIGAGSIINITVTPTGQNVTCKGVGSQFAVALFRGPDA
jgi:hypothetical protein